MSDIGSVLFYIVVLLTSGFFFSLYKSRKKLIRRCGISISIIIPTVLAGIRYDVGTDYENYNGIFTLLRNITVKDIFAHNLRFEKGFLILSKICTCFCSNKMIFAIIAFLTISIFVYTILNQYQDYNLTVCYIVFLFLDFTTSLNIMRQYLAVVLVFFGLKYVFENKPIKFLLIVIFAMTFHLTAVLALPMWFFWNHKENKSISLQIKAPAFVGAVLIIINWKKILKYFINFNIPFISKYAGYLSGNEANNKSFYLHVVIALIMLFLVKYLKRYDDRILFFMYAYVIGILIEYTGFYITFVKRIGLYYMFPGILLFSMLERSFAGRQNKQIVRIMICTFWIMYFIVSASILKQGGLIPYKWS